MKMRYWFDFDQRQLHPINCPLIWAYMPRKSPFLLIEPYLSNLTLLEIEALTEEFLKTPINNKEQYVASCFAPFVS